MSAGHSAGAEARRQLALADAHSAAEAEARATAARYSIAEVTEKRTAVALSPLTAVGHHLLADRRWPGSRHAQVDLVVVGPGGVFIVDTKAWAEVVVAGGRIHRGQQDVTEELMALADLAYTAEADLAEVGLAPGEVRPVVVLAGRQGVDERVGPVRVVGERDVLRHVAGFGTRLTPHQVDLVLARALTLFPQVNAPAPVVTTIPEPVVPAPSAAPEQDALFSAAEVDAALLAGLLAAPIEQWMSFLHPAQARLVRRSFNGPSRIRGAAGTGKTVVGLHRAAYLARTRPGRVLVTTYVRTLPQVLATLLGRMAPDVADRVDFVGTHALALRLLRERGVAVDLHPGQVAEAMDAAWWSVGRTGPLAASRLDQRYWEDEIRQVLKGRGLTEFDQYAELVRAGRRHRLGADLRRAVWDLHLAYDAELRRRQVHDFADVVLLAQAELGREPMRDRYASVVVDEAQDLTASMVRVLHALVGDAPDGLTLIGDGQQTLYPGGYTLAEVGVSIAGRGVVLDVNYRNTRQVVELAQSLVGADELTDLDGAATPPDQPAEVVRSGPEPVVERCVSRRQCDAKMVEHARALVRTEGVRLGDIGVLCATHGAVRRAAAVLRSAGAPVVLLEDYDGTPVDAIRIGTVKRAKGLEFARVLLPDVRGEQVSAGPPPVVEAARERWELDRRELYVAMTRARDGLWVGVV